MQVKETLQYNMTMRRVEPTVFVLKFLWLLNWTAMVSSPHRVWGHKPLAQKIKWEHVLSQHSWHSQLRVQVWPLLAPSLGCSHLFTASLSTSQCLLAAWAQSWRMQPAILPDFSKVVNKMVFLVPHLSLHSVLSDSASFSLIGVPAWLLWNY